MCASSDVKYKEIMNIIFQTDSVCEKNEPNIFRSVNTRGIMLDYMYFAQSIAVKTDTNNNLYLPTYLSAVYSHPVPRAIPVPYIL